MAYLPAAVLALITVYLAYRLNRAWRIMRELADSVRTRETTLIERRPGYGIDRCAGELRLELNTLIAEARAVRDRDRDYLHQIETTLGSIREAVLILDESNYVRMANEAARQLLASDRELLGRRIESLLPSVAFLDYMKSVRGGNRKGNELVELARGGERLWFEVTGAVVKDAGGQHLCLFVLHDITKLKALENMRTEFVANVSHELRTPVTVIRGFTDTLLEEGDELSSEDRARFLGKIQRNVVRLNSLLEDLLTLSRLEGRAHVLQTEELKLNDVVAEAASNFKDRKPDAVAFEMIADPAVPAMQLDPLRITQVVENLLDNACRHARGLTRLVVRTTLAGDHVECSVEDNGCGIPPADVPHIFERFYRVDKGRSRELGGTGLGLSIVKHTILQHGGNVFVESRVGEGTRIGFTIPLPPEA